MATIRLRATLIIEYDADTEHYNGVTDPLGIAALDQEQFSDNLIDLTSTATYETSKATLTVEPLASGDGPVPCEPGTCEHECPGGMCMRISNRTG